MKCRYCNKHIDDEETVCPHCGQAIGMTTPQREDEENEEENEEQEEEARPLDGISEKSRGVGGLLCLFFGVFGLHRFYAGRPWTGLLQLVSFGGLGFWSFIDLILLILGRFRDGRGLRMER